MPPLPTLTLSPPSQLYPSATPYVQLGIWNGDDLLLNAGATAIAAGLAAETLLAGALSDYLFSGTVSAAAFPDSVAAPYFAQYRSCAAATLLAFNDAANTTPISNRFELGWMKGGVLPRAITKNVTIEAETIQVEGT